MATKDPFDVRTFSGYSHRLFGELSRTGCEPIGLATRDLRWYDFVTGAANIGGFARGKFRGRHAPRVNPDWYWSRRGFERFCRRFDARLAQLGPASAVIVQIGTHVRTNLPGYRSFCVTDATVIQAVAAGEFSVSGASARVVDEAISCQREVLHACEKVFVLSRWAATSVVQDYGYPEDRVVVLGAGANVDDRLPRRVDEERPYILFVGADWEQKGGPLLLEAFRLVRAALPSARLVVVGCRPAIAGEGVEVVGPLSRRVPSEQQRLFELYAGASCFSILPTFDAFPNVLLEAGWFGVPVVSTAEGSRPEAILDVETGLLAQRRDPSEVAALLLQLLTDVPTAKRLGEAAARRVIERFTWPVVAQRLGDEIFQRVDELQDGR